MQLIIITIYATGVFFLLGLLAFAFAPRIINSSSIPLVPLFGMSILAVVTSAWHYLSIDKVFFQIAIIGCASLGVFRAYLHGTAFTKMAFNAKYHWLLVAIVLLPVAVKLGMTAFDVNDEIYSWNLWANQIYLGQPIDYYFTQAPYPTLFSSYVAGVYLIFGSTEYQSVAKLTLWLLPLCSLALILAKYLEKGQIIRGWVISILIIYGAGLEKKFAIGLADPFMATTLVCAFYCLFNSCSGNKKELIGWLTLSAFFISVSAITKQAALVWSLFFYPLTFIVFLKTQNLPRRLLVLPLLPIAVSVIWWLTVGDGFQKNDGVIQASTAGRGLVEQFFYAVKNLATDNTVGLVVLVYLFTNVLRNKSLHMKVVAIGCLFSSLLWLLFGSYDLRLGMHVFMLLLLADSFITKKADGAKTKTSSVAGVLAMSLVVVVSTLYSLNKYKSLSNDYSVTDVLSASNGREKQLVKLFGIESKPYLEKMFDNDATVWAGSNYIYGPLYGAVNVLKPELDELRPIQYLKSNDVNYVLLSHQSFAFGDANSRMRKIIEKNTACFGEVALADNLVGLTIFKLNKNTECIDEKENRN